MRVFHVGLVGDYSPEVTAHQAIPRALQIAAGVLGCAVEETWLPTAELAADGAIDVDRFDGVWAVPASPYRSFDGALRGIRHARERGVPFLGTCGGFQHAVIEYAANALGHHEAEHAELNPAADVPLFAPLACAMVEVDAKICFTPGSRIEAVYGAPAAIERYRCSFGMNPAYRSWFEHGAMAVTGVDEAGDPRVVELAGHVFFVGTAYQPERSALSGLSGLPHPLIVAFVRALAQ